MFIGFAELQQMALRSADVTMPCTCHGAALWAWQPLPYTLELDQFDELGSLVEDPYAIPSVAEYHPNGTRYDSDDAPIAPRYFPCNLSQVVRCVKCGRHYLRYNEAGGYFSELRMRALRPQLLVDAAL